MKKKSLAFLATLCLAGGALGIFAACGGNQGTKDTYAPGDTIIEETETQYVYDSEGNVIYATQSGSSINVKYFVSETAYITLGGKKANEMQITGYSGEVTEVSVSAIEEAISVGDQKISIVGVADYAFKGCDTLTTADLTKREKSLSFEVGTGAFSSCINLASVTLPDNTQISDAKIDDGAFYGCLSLATVNVSDNFNEIGEYAFAFCASLNSFTVPEKVKVINASTFYACEKLNTVSFNGTAVRSIMDSAFADTALSSANLSAQTTLRYVGNNAFDNTAISRVSLPSSVSYIGYHAFYNCENLTTVNVPFLGNTINSSTSSAFTGIYGMSGEDERALSVTVDKVADIPDNAFNGYETLSSLTINSFADEATYYVYEADGITVDYKIDVEPTYEIGNSAFYNCKALSSVSIPSTTKAIGNSAFYGCEELNSATIPEKVESIGSYAFYGCDSIYEVEIPASVEYIGGGAFYDCNNLTGVTIGQLDRLVENEDYDSSSTSDPVVYKSLGALSNWMDVSDLRTVTVNSAYTLPNNFLDGAEYVNTVSVTFNKLSYEGKDYEETASIGAYAFRDCIRLNSLTLTNADNHIEEIGSYAFYRCNYLSSLTLPEGLDTIGSHAFDYCTKLSEITIPESVSSVGSGALANCYNLKTLTVKNYSWLETTETVTMVSEDPSDPYSDIVEQVSYSYEYKSLGRINTWFTGTEEYFTYTTEYSMGSSLGSIFTPNSLKTITLDNVCVLGANALSGFGGVKTINLTFVDQIKVPNEEVYYAEIDSYALYNCENLDTLNIEGAEYIDTIGNRAFMNCKSLDLDVAAFEELTMIGENAFSYTAIDSLTFGGRVMSIGNYAFAYCDNLEKVNISAALASIGNIIFMDSPVKELNICNYAGGAISDIASLFFNSYSYATSDCALETVTITGLEKFSDINAYAFRNLKTVKVISIDYAVDAENAEKVVIESTLFSGCDMLTNVYLPVAVEKVFIKSTLSNWNSSYSALNFSATEYYQLSSATTVPSEYNNYWCYNLGSVSEIEEPAYATNVTYTLNLNLGETAVSVDILAEDGILTQTAIDTAINTKLEELKTAAEEAGTEPAYTEFAKEGYSLLGWTLSISGK
ncbi:MAG: leucine-rich repeat domain-containing protein, partial [Candidatus Coproplasma sp.]